MEQMSNEIKFTPGRRWRVKKTGEVIHEYALIRISGMVYIQPREEVSGKRVEGYLIEEIEIDNSNIQTLSL